MHVVGVSSLTAGHLTLVPELKAALDKEGRGDIMIVVGGVIPPSDYDELFRSGAKAVFGPGTNIPEAAADLVEKLNEQLGYADKRRRSKEPLSIRQVQGRNGPALNSHCRFPLHPMQIGEPVEDHIG